MADGVWAELWGRVVNPSLRTVFRYGYRCGLAATRKHPWVGDQEYQDVHDLVLHQLGCPASPRTHDLTEELLARFDMRPRRHRRLLVPAPHVRDWLAAVDADPNRPGVPDDLEAMQRRVDELRARIAERNSGEAP